MNASNRNASRVDRAAVGATFAAAVFTLFVSNAAMQPAATPFIAGAQIVRLAMNASAASEPCADDALAAGQAQPAATGRN